MVNKFITRYKIENTGNVWVELNYTWSWHTNIYNRNIKKDLKCLYISLQVIK